MLEPGLEHTLSDDERVGCGVNTGLEPATHTLTVKAYPPVCTLVANETHTPTMNGRII